MAALVLSLLGAAIWVIFLKPGITRANSERVRLGMTEADVEVVLGPPRLGADRRDRQLTAREVLPGPPRRLRRL